ncbi:MAG: DUF2785 domain-containing protein [Kofleriaceae bacterium]|jgi:hypothetical protein|nr:DUF2785 domain-containing protein [Kofleriaceae bacterium]MBP9166801.1 DUF2785 domain-containing protein [Kofleriaceae bacterium]MBP9857095.1 DUF2785 domain-containing protein [Kofleriaceae bacterium]
MMRSSGTLLALLVAACTARSVAPVAPAPSGAPPEEAASASASASTLTPERRAWWEARRAGEPLPAGARADDAVDELAALLADRDPTARDRLGFEVLVRWLEPGGLSDAAVDRLRDLLVARTAGPIVAGDAVFARSFAALALSAITAREVKAPRWDVATLGAQVAAAVAYAGRETDLRGYTGAATGWAHAAAHAADWLKFLARHPRLDAAGARAILDGVAALVARPHGVRLHHGEDERVAAAIRAVARRALVDDAGLDAWLATMLAPVAAGWPEPFDPAVYATQRNARDALVSAFVALTIDDSPGAAAALARLRAAMTR